MVSKHFGEKVGNNYKIPFLTPWEFIQAIIWRENRTVDHELVWGKEISGQRHGQEETAVHIGRLHLGMAAGQARHGSGQSTDPTITTQTMSSSTQQTSYTKDGHY